MSTADYQRELGDKVLCRIDSVVEKGGRKRKGRTKPHPIPIAHSALKMTAANEFLTHQN